MTKSYQQYKADARQKAIEWSWEISSLSLSYSQISDIQHYFYQLGRKYGLLREFAENGII